MTVILLIRHGHNDLLSDKLVGRLPGVHLNQAGRQEANRLGEILAESPIEAVFASPLERTQETAEPIAGRHGLEVQTLPALIEMDFGEWQGEKIENLKEKKLWKDIHERPSIIRFPGGEDYTTAQERVVQGLLKLSTQYNEKDVLVCVAHGDVIRLAVTHFLGVPLDDFHRIHISPASISVLYLHQGKASFGPINYTEKFPKLF